MYNVRKTKIGKTEQMDALAQSSGDLYRRTVLSFWRTVRRKDRWLSSAALMRWQNSKQLHAHSADAAVQSFFAALKSWRALRKTDPKAKPPRCFGRYFKVQWKASAIRLRNGNLVLANGKGNEPLIINGWEYGLPALVEMGWDGEQYELRCIYKSEAPSKIVGGSVAGVDLGEIHLATVVDGKGAIIVNGRELRSKKRYQNKLKGQLSAMIDVKKKGSSRRRRLIRSKQRQLLRLKNQIKDIHHKQTTRLVRTLRERGVGTVVIGDVKDIRDGLDYGKKTNQKLHQWTCGESRRMIEYKSERLGMACVLQEESYTSQTCPACGFRHKPKGRVFRCPSCGLVCHRDVVGGANIRAKYLGTFGSPVVGAMASPTGVRFRPDMRCSSGGMLDAS
jgi:putative transposase